MIQTESLKEVEKSLKGLPLSKKAIDKILDFISYVEYSESKSKVIVESDYKTALKNFTGKSKHKDLWGKSMGREYD